MRQYSTLVPLDDPMADAADITLLLESARNGDRAALDHVLSTLYRELHSMARWQLSGAARLHPGCHRAGA